MTRGTVWAALLLMVGASGLARGQPSSASCGGGGGGGDRAPAPAGFPSSSPSAWPAPLDRVVPIQARGVSLRDALDRLSAAARIRFSYSTELLPLDRSVCLVRSAVRVGDALTDLLRGTSVEPVVAGADQVVLAPAAESSRAAAAGGGALLPDDSAPAMARSVGVLDRVVVTGTAVGGPQRGLPVALGVIDGRQLAERRVTSLAQLLDGAVPGVWAWTQSPSALLARYGSVRGASAFGVSAPKVYIDGIEVANSLLVTQLDPEGVERVEVIRGPQGAALYGADAISGVINIVTRHGGAPDGAARVRLRSTGGVAASDFTPRPAVAQEHALTLRAGSGVRTATLGIWGSSVGEFVPDAYARRLTASGGMRLVGARTSLSSTARLFAARAGAGASPLLFAAGDNDGAADGPQSVLQYTVGSTLSVARGERWTHAVVVGADGYRLAGVPDDAGPAASRPALRAVTGGADRASVRASSVAQLVSRDDAAAALTLGAELSQLREEPAGGGDEESGDAAAGYLIPRVDWRTTAGVLAQLNASFRETLYLSGGLRFENSEVFEDASTLAALPMLGASLVRRGPLGTTVKYRAAYGKGIRSPRTVIRETTQPMAHWAVRYYDLSPEQQSGIETGVDLFVGRSLSLQVTRFDQLASGLIQRVSVPAGRQRGPARSSGYSPPSIALQNLGEIANRGWELQASLGGRGTLAPLSLTGTLSLVDSRVRSVAPGYTGDLRVGDRMLEVPARTAGLTALWSSPRWSGSVTASRAADWISYDRLSLERDFPTSDDFAARQPTGEELRQYWLHYDGVTRLRATASRTIRRGLSLQLTSENLLGQQRGEPDNLTVLPGRTVTGGVMVEF